MNRFEDRAEAVRLVSTRHESDCGRPGIFTEISNTEAGWTMVIEHYDQAKPLEHVGTPCRYVAEHAWHISPT
jgi:hypothetical protein